MTIRVQETAFDPWVEVSTHKDKKAHLAGNHGATAVFVGSLRDFNQGHLVDAMTLEHYPGMTEKALERICQEANSRWALSDYLVIHRYGPLKPGDPIVLVAVWSAHRDTAFSACRYIIDELKTRAPFWKQETTPTGNRWVSPE